jgi:sialate O-acetylesterase
MRKFLFILLMMFLASGTLTAQKEQLIVDLRGNWKFEIGDNRKYSDPSFDDSKWAEIFVPSDWENEGFAGYDGYAWYRKNVVIPQPAAGASMHIHIVADDVCGVYVNGQLVGEGGQFPPDFETAYNIEHKFFIPSSFVKFNQRNTIAVRVYDDRLNGGIVKGKVGIYAHERAIPALVAFPERWKFKKGDNEQWSDPAFDDSKWQELIVPAPWDFQGYREYDGFGWYRVTFDAPNAITNDKLVVMLGRIDDFDEAYLNGELIGRTGRIRSDGSVGKVRDEYMEFRAYEISGSMLQKGKRNVLAVRVYDNFKVGGIYEGPLAIVRERDFRRWSAEFNADRGSRNTFQRFMERMFDQ